MVIAVWLLLGVAVLTEQAPPKHVPMETFQFEEYFFTFYTQSANWLEAFTICRATHARLAVVNTKARADFLARVITETQSGFQDVWIGGMFMKDQWMWAPTGQPINKIPKEDREEGYPPWDHEPTHRGKNCLAFDRKGFEKPMFIELRCMMQKAFVCEKSVVKAIDNYPQMGIVMTYKQTKYIAYHARVTWEEALAFCRQTGAILATIPDLKTAYFVVGIMRRSRPEFEDLWIGGQYLFNNWVWLSNNTVIPYTSESTGYPPWKNNNTIPKEGRDCLMIDHHACTHGQKHHGFLGIHARRDLCEEPVFIETECNRRKPFICEKAPELPPIYFVNGTYNGVIYGIFTRPATWQNAYIECKERNMSLASLDSADKLTFVVNVISEETLSGDASNLWLGGKYSVEKDMWSWTGTNKTIPRGNQKENSETVDWADIIGADENSTSTNNTTELIKGLDTTTEGGITDEGHSFPPWCGKEGNEAEGECLNLDREGQPSSVWYGMDCATEQGYVCEVIVSKDVVAMSNSNSVYVLGNETMSFGLALRACTKKKMHLATPNNITEALKVSLEIPEDTLVWVGGSRENGIWTWKQTGEIIPDVIQSDGYPPWEMLDTFPGAQCLAVRAGFDKWPLFREVPCGRELFPMCQTTKTSRKQ